VRLREEMELSEKLRMSINSLHDQLRDSIASLSSRAKQSSVLRSRVVSLTKETKRKRDSLRLVVNQIDLVREELNRERMKSIDRTRITASGKNKRLTVSAQKTRQMEMSVSVPAGLSDLHLIVYGPEGLEEDENSERMTFTRTSDSRFHTASIDTRPVLADEETIDLVFTPEGKLRPGIYELKVFNGDGYVGSTSIKLK
jgi:hypothetical protein